MKNLANCKPSEFVAQTVRIKKVAQEWLDATKLLDILSTAPEYITSPADASAEERAEVIRQNAIIQQDQGMKNLSRIIDAAFEQNPQKTLEILALCCFIEPENVDDNPVSFYMEAINELLHEKAVLDFFSSLAQLAKMNTSKQ